MKKTLVFCFLILILISSIAVASEKTYFDNIKFGMSTFEVMENIDFKIKDTIKKEQNGILMTSLIYKGDFINSTGFYIFGFADNKLATISRLLFANERETVDNYHNSWEMDLSFLDGSGYLSEPENKEGITAQGLNSPNYEGFLGLIETNEINMSELGITNNIPKEIDIPVERDFMLMDMLISKQIKKKITK